MIPLQRISPHSTTLVKSGNLRPHTHNALNTEHLGKIPGIKWNDGVSNEEIWDRFHQPPISAIICEWCLHGLGHFFRLPESHLAHKVLIWTPAGWKQRRQLRMKWEQTQTPDLSTDHGLTPPAHRLKIVHNGVPWLPHVANDAGTLNKCLGTVPHSTKWKTRETVVNRNKKKSEQKDI